MAGYPHWKRTFHILLAEVELPESDAGDQALLSLSQTIYVHIILDLLELLTCVAACYAGFPLRSIQSVTSFPTAAHEAAAGYEPA